jgi:hypothetical protein
LIVGPMIVLAACQLGVSSPVPDETIPSLPYLSTLPPATVAPTPTKFIAIPTTPEPTWTPVATLPTEIRKQNLIELFSTNGGCDFPCWWGVSPGDPIQKVYALASVVGKSPGIDGSDHYYTWSLDNLNLVDFDMNFHIGANQIVQHIDISIREPSRFRDYYVAFEEQLSLASLLGRYGKPSEVLLLVEPRIEPDSQIEYALFLAYEPQGFGVEYSGLVDSEDPIRICSVKLNDYHLRYVSLYMRDPQQVIVERNGFYTNDFQPLDQVASMSSDVFFQVFSNDESSPCIETSFELWR